MSRHRELKNAQAEVNQATAALVDHIEGVDITRPEAPNTLFRMRRLAEAWREFERIRNDFDGDAPASARRTSINAAKANLPLKGSMRRSILEAVVATHREFGAGMTCDQLESRLRKPHQTVSPAVNHLESAGWIVDSKMERMTRNGQPAIVWMPTEKAIKRVSEEVGL